MKSQFTIDYYKMFESIPSLISNYREERDLVIHTDSKQKISNFKLTREVLFK